jgi:hypothetical protein
VSILANRHTELHRLPNPERPHGPKKEKELIEEEEEDRRMREETRRREVGCLSQAKKTNPKLITKEWYMRWAEVPVIVYSPERIQYD